ncbi:hypothetical protein D9M71_627480 [compost metagenome]
MKAMLCSPSRVMRPLSRMACRRAGMVSVSMTSGCSPSRPSSTALSLPWPLPVAPSEPYSSALTLAVRASRPSRRSPSAKRAAARIGPTVCELEGPMPILNRSKTLSDMVTSCQGFWADGEPCGSGFTRECGGKATIAFAGEPAPTEPATQG